MQSLKALVLAKQAELDSRTTEIENLKLLILKLKRMHFGRRSEKLDHDIQQLELRLEDLEAHQAAAEPPPVAPATVVLKQQAPATKIYLCAGATDMRKGFDGLYALVRDRLELEPLSGHVFLFSNAQRNRLKLIFWDGSGLWVCAKRLERGYYRWPAAEAGQSKIVLSHEEMALLLGGIDLAGSRRRSWFRKTMEEENRVATEAEKSTLNKT